MTTSKLKVLYINNDSLFFEDFQYNIWKVIINSNLLTYYDQLQYNPILNNAIKDLINDFK